MKDALEGMKNYKKEENASDTLLPAQKTQDSSRYSSVNYVLQLLAIALVRNAVQWACKDLVVLTVKRYMKYYNLMHNGTWYTCHCLTLNYREFLHRRPIQRLRRYLQRLQICL